MRFNIVTVLQDVRGNTTPLGKGPLRPPLHPPDLGRLFPPLRTPAPGTPRQAVNTGGAGGAFSVARKPRPPPFTVRLSPERARPNSTARADRAGLSIGGYFISAVFDLPPPRQSRRPTLTSSYCPRSWRARSQHIGVEHQPACHRRQRRKLARQPPPCNRLATTSA